MEHVYNGKYQEFIYLAFINYCEEVLGDLFSWTDKGLIIASVKTDYLQSTFPEYQIEVVPQRWREKFKNYKTDLNVNQPMRKI